MRSRPARAVTASYAPNPNVGLERFLSSSGGTGLSFDAMSWANSAKSDMSWNSMSWNSQSWSDLSWSDQSWASMSWADMSWNSMSWTDMSWADMSWADSSQEDAAEGDTSAPAPPATRSTPPTSRRLRPIRRPPSPWTGSIRWRRSASTAPVDGCGPGSGPGCQHGQLAPDRRAGARDRGEGPLRRALAAGPHPDGGSDGGAPEWGMRGSPPQP